MWLEDEREKSVDLGSGSWIADVAAAEGTDRLDFDALRDERLARARDVLREEGLSAFLCFEAANVRYLTGLPPNAWDERDRSRCAVLTADEGPFLLETGPLSQAPSSHRPGQSVSHSTGNHPDRALALGLDPDDFLWIPVDTEHNPFDALLLEGVELLRRRRRSEQNGRMGLDRMDVVERAGREGGGPGNVNFPAPCSPTRVPPSCAPGP